MGLGFSFQFCGFYIDFFLPFCYFISWKSKQGQRNPFDSAPRFAINCKDSQGKQDKGNVIDYLGGRDIINRIIGRKMLYSARFLVVELGGPVR